MLRLQRHYVWSRRWQREKLALSLAVKLRVSIKTENSRCNLEYLVKTLTRAGKCVLTFPGVLSSQLRFASCVLGVLRLFTKKLAKKDANFNGDFCFVRCFSVRLWQWPLRVSDPGVSTRPGQLKYPNWNMKLDRGPLLDLTFMQTLLLCSAINNSCLI